MESNLQVGSVLTEGYMPSDWLKFEERDKYSRDNVTFLAGSGAPFNYLTGMIVAQITASGKWTQLNPAANDGSEVAAGFCYLPVTAPDGVDVVGSIVRRHGSWVEIPNTWPAGISDPEKATARSQLAALGLIERTKA